MEEEKEIEKISGEALNACFRGRGQSGPYVCLLHTCICVCDSYIYIVYYTTSMCVRISLYSTISMSRVRLSGFF